MSSFRRGARRWKCIPTRTTIHLVRVLLSVLKLWDKNVTWRKFSVSELSELWISVLNLNFILFFYMCGSGSVLGIRIRIHKLLNMDPVRIQYGSGSTTLGKKIRIILFNLYFTSIRLKLNPGFFCIFRKGWARCQCDDQCRCLLPRDPGWEECGLAA